MNHHISLCGIKHAGKTTIANELARLTGTSVTDTDDALAGYYNQTNHAGLTVREIYRTLGDDLFRRLEADVLRQVCRTESRLILSLGGGTLSNPYVTAEDKKQLGFLCCIDVPDEIAFQRIKAEGLPPFLLKETDPYAAFCAQNKARRAIFTKEAALTVHPVEAQFTPADTAQYILTRFKESFL